MAEFIFNKILTESGDNLSTEELFDILLENQDNISVIIDYTHVVFVDQSPRTVYVTKGD